MRSKVVSSPAVRSIHYSYVISMLYVVGAYHITGTFGVSIRFTLISILVKWRDVSGIPVQQAISFRGTAASFLLRQILSKDHPRHMQAHFQQLIDGPVCIAG